MVEEKFHSGFVALVGRPNVGKSTLMNAVLGEKVSIVSAHAQTTRNKLMRRRRGIRLPVYGMVKIPKLSFLTHRECISRRVNWGRLFVRVR